MLTKAVLIVLIELQARMQGFDPKLAVAVATVESKLNPDATGTHGERGLFQLHPKYFKGGQYYEPLLNIQAGIKHLKAAQAACGKKMPSLQWLACYNAGITAGRKFKYPSRNPYVNQVETVLYGKPRQARAPEVQQEESTRVAYVYSSR